MNAIGIIQKKRDGLALSSQEIDYFIHSVVDGSMPDYQIAALLMAIRLNGMDAQEMSHLTMAMMRSGDVADLRAIEGIKVDKHSTGGVGDTVTLIAAPLAAACGCKVAKMSGRSLGHTGGTIDKLESIGMNTALSIQQMAAQVERIGLCVAQQSGELAPADKTLYALRDVTATVDSIPLIASSILSKKFATGADAIVLDVKAGSGALIQDPQQADRLAHAMVDIGRASGRRICAMVTDMRQPLGSYIGNRLEIYEAVRTLMGRKESDLYSVSMAIAEKMVKMGLQIGSEEAKTRLDAAFASGAGLEKLRQWIWAQGGDVQAVDRPETLMRGEQLQVRAAQTGCICRTNAAQIGMAAQLLGAGRLKKGDAIDPYAGLILHARIGDFVQAGDPLVTVVHHRKAAAQECAALLAQSITISDEKPAPMPLIHALIDGDGSAL